MFAFQRSSESGQWQDMSAIGKSQSLVQGLRDLGDAARGPRVFLKLRDAAAFAVDAVAFALHLLERMLLDPELRFANQSHLWFARHLALWI